MTDINRRLSAALRAQAAGVSTGSPAEPVTPPSAVPPSHGQARAESRMPGWAILALAVLLGAMASGLAGLISTW
jgi:hypothetical protein